MKKKSYLFFVLIGIVLISIGSFKDLEISQICFNITDKISVFLAGYGESPAVIVSWLGALILMPIYKKRNDKKGIWKVHLLLIVPLYIFYETYIYYVDYLIIGLFLQFIICFISAKVLSKLIEDCDEKKLIKFGYLCLLLPLCEIVACGLIKVLWARPRYRSIFNTENLEFVNWYQINYSFRSYFLKDKLLGFNEFCSFPSGHTANAECFIVLALYPILKKSFKKYKTIIYVFVFLFTAIVGFSRIVMGAHFLSDITFGYLVTLTIYYYLSRKFIEE